MYTQFPTISDPAAAMKTQAANQKTGNSGNAPEDSMSVDNLGTTFLNLLITELKSQDPLSPMDGTQMVGQIVSLNQLDQLLSINQLLKKTLS